MTNHPGQIEEGIPIGKPSRFVTLRVTLRTRMLDLITTGHETDDGYTLGFAPGSIDRVREFVAFESKCCSFMTFSIDEGSDGLTWLGISGPEGTKEFVRGWLPARILEGIDGHAS